MTALSREEALRRFPELVPAAQARIELGAARDAELTLAIVRGFLSRGREQGWSFDEDLEWSQAGDGEPRALDEMCAQFRTLVLERGDGQTARRLRDRFLDFYPPEEQHVPIIEAIYDREMAIDEEGEILPARSPEG